MNVNPIKTLKLFIIWKKNVLKKTYVTNDTLNRVANESLNDILKPDIDMETNI